MNQEHYTYLLYNVDCDIPYNMPKKLLIDNKTSVKNFKTHLGKKLGHWKNNQHTVTYRVGMWEKGIILGTGRWIVLSEDDEIDFSIEPRLDIQIKRV